MKIILLGSKGLVGREVEKYLLKKQYSLTSVDIDTLDLTDHDQTSVFFNQNKADILINLFGKNDHIKQLNKQSTVLNIEEEEIRSYLEINVVILFRVCRLFIENNPQSKIFNFSSLYGHHVPNPKYYGGNHKSIGYCMSKAAVVMLTKYLAVHFPSTEVIDIVLGGVENNQNSNFVEKYNEDVPKNRMLTKEEIPPIIEGLFKTKYITGSSIFIDGGKNLM